MTKVTKFEIGGGVALLAILVLALFAVIVGLASTETQAGDMTPCRVVGTIDINDGRINLADDGSVLVVYRCADSTARFLVADGETVDGPPWVPPEIDNLPVPIEVLP